MENKIFADFISETHKIRAAMGDGTKHNSELQEGYYAGLVAGLILSENILNNIIKQIQEEEHGKEKS